MVNSSELAATFVLVLPQPIPVAISLVQDIQLITGELTLTMVNSSELAAMFVLVLPQPIPVAMSLLQAIQLIMGKLSSALYY